MTTYLNHSSEHKTSMAPPTGNRKIIDYKRKSSAGLAPRFIFECAVKLNMKPLTSATAAIIFHRFFREVETDTYDEYVSRIYHLPFLAILHYLRLIFDIFFHPFS